MLKFIKETRRIFTPSGSGRRMALYKCSCGSEKEICIRNVRKGITRSCGCLNIRQITALGKIKGKKRGNYKHGMFGTRFYNIFHSMKGRCNPNCISNSKYYSDKGIKCFWNSFDAFKKDMYLSYIKHCERYGKKNTSIDRIDSKKHYCKSNCVWATNKEQAKEKIGNSSLAKNFR